MNNSLISFLVDSKAKFLTTNLLEISKSFFYFLLFSLFLISFYLLILNFSMWSSNKLFYNFFKHFIIDSWFLNSIKPYPEDKPSLVFTIFTDLKSPTLASEKCFSKAFSVVSKFKFLTYKILDNWFLLFSSSSSILFSSSILLLFY